VLPQASSGRVALVAIGFTYKSRVPVEAWAGWYRTTIGSTTDVTFFEVPMIGGLGTLGRWLHHGGFDTPRADELKALLASLVRPVTRSLATARTSPAHRRSSQGFRGCGDEHTQHTQPINYTHSNRAPSGQLDVVLGVLRRSSDGVNHADQEASPRRQSQAA
jgi:hypothetical protein